MKLIELEVRKNIMERELRNSIMLYGYASSQSEARELTLEIKKQKEEYLKSIKDCEDVTSRLQEILATTYISVMGYTISLATAEKYCAYYNNVYKQKGRNGRKILPPGVEVNVFSELEDLPILNYYDSIKYCSANLNSDEDEKDSEYILVDPFDIKNSDIEKDYNEFFEKLMAEYTKAMSSIEV